MGAIGKIIVNERQIRKLLLALFDAGGELTRKQVSVEVFNRNLTRSALDELLASPDLAGLVSVTRSPRRDRQGHGTHARPCGRHSLRYFLTIAGWATLACGLRRGATPLQVNTEHVQHWFQGLVHDRDPWATTTARLAARGREWEALERHNKEQPRIQRKAVADAHVKRPSAKRHRSPADRAARRQFFDQKMTEHGLIRDSNGKYRPIEEIRGEEAVEETSAGLDDTQQRYSLSPPPAPPTGFDSVPLPTPPGQNWNSPSASALLARISRAGYQTSHGKVLYAGAWIAPEEWRARMPHVEL